MPLPAKVATYDVADLRETPGEELLFLEPGGVRILSLSKPQEQNELIAIEGATTRRCARREALYGEFIREASTLFGDAFEHDLDDPAKLVNLYAIVNKIRLFGEPETLEEAERVMQRIGETYFAPNKDLAAFSDIRHARDLDPLCAFSIVCRKELAIARR
ncbi:hypothetical protein [Methylobacterium sp.]|uniref:hypothetical protein n=1 Tax=Methylobacterium sp. TaxID=409 RepID=UPI003B011329